MWWLYSSEAAAFTKIRTGAVHNPGLVCVLWSPTWWKVGCKGCGCLQPPNNSMKVFPKICIYLCSLVSHSESFFILYQIFLWSRKAAVSMPVGPLNITTSKSTFIKKHCSEITLQKNRRQLFVVFWQQKTTNFLTQVPEEQKTQYFAIPKIAVCVAMTKNRLCKWPLRRRDLSNNSSLTNKGRLINTPWEKAWLSL